MPMGTAHAHTRRRLRWAARVRAWQSAALRIGGRTKRGGRVVRAPLCGQERGPRAARRGQGHATRTLEGRARAACAVKPRSGCDQSQTKQHKRYLGLWLANGARALASQLHSAIVALRRPRARREA